MDKKKSRSQSARRSRRKGASFEREVVRKLTEALYPDGSGSVRRTPLSGGWGAFVRADGVAFKGKVENGSLQLDKRWDIHLECKIREDLSNVWFFALGGDNPVQWFLEARRKASHPVVLVFRRSGCKETYFMMELEEAWKKFNENLPEKYLLLTLKEEIFIIGDFNDFLALLKKVWFKEV